MERLFGAVAAIAAWSGWLAICPALGFPTLGTVGMINRVLYKQIPEAGHDPDFWLGWLILIAALGGAIALFFMVERLHLVRTSVGTGVIFGLVLWLVVGLVIMPLLGVIDPTSAAPQQPPDAMRATLMMHTLGPLAAVGALIAWILFGAILGATGSSRSSAEMVSRT
jgi:FtsH-binding integral membrane protein